MTFNMSACVWAARPNTTTLGKFNGLAPESRIARLPASIFAIVTAIIWQCSNVPRHREYNEIDHAACFRRPARTPKPEAQ